MALARKPPAAYSGVLGWLRANLFSSWFNSLVTVVVAALVAWTLSGLFAWAFGSATWTQVWNNLKLFAVYRYPEALLWRPLLVVGLLMGLLGLSVFATEEGIARILRGTFWQIMGLILILSAVAFVASWGVRWMWLFASALSLGAYAWGRTRPALLRQIGWLWIGGLLVSVLLLYGIPGVHSGPLEVVSVREWGGFMLTFVLTTGIVVSFPLGVALALGRRGNLPIIKYFSVSLIELVRGAPLITWLFIASLMVPLLLNVGPDAISPLAKAYVAITLFSTAYMAENVRGGLQSVPKGQAEAARALGLSSWQTTRLIVLPQALKAVIPAIVGQAIGLFKDTSLVFVVGLFDLFNVHNIVAQQQSSLEVTGGIRLELSLFLAVLYFFFAYRMSLASRQLEDQLGVGKR